MLRVRDAMTRDVVTLGPEASAAEAWSACAEEMKIRHLPGRRRGASGRARLRQGPQGREPAAWLRRSEQGRAQLERLRDIMSTDLATIHPLDTIEHAAREIHDRKIGCLPVVADGAARRDHHLLGHDARPSWSSSGRTGAGSWVEVEVANEPGMLANVTDVIRDHQVNIAGVFLTPAPRASNRLIVLRLETTNPSGTVKALEGAGYKVTTVESSRPLEPTLEES